MCFAFEVEPRRSPASKDINGITATWYDVFTICFQVLPFFHILPSSTFTFAHLLVQVGSAVVQAGWTALCTAAQQNKVQSVGRLLEAKADPNAPNCMGPDLSNACNSWTYLSTALQAFSNRPQMQGSERLLRTMPIQMNPDVYHDDGHHDGHES